MYLCPHGQIALCGYHIYRVVWESCSFPVSFDQGGAKRDCLDYWGRGGGGKYVSVCKACGKLGGSGGMLFREIFILDLLLDTIWRNLGLFLHKHNLPFIVSIIKAFIIDLHVKQNSQHIQGGQAKAKGGGGRNAP